VSTLSGSVQKRFTEALDELIAQVKEDHSILAAILCGSLSHHTVWEKSDIGAMHRTGRRSGALRNS